MSVSAQSVGRYDIIILDVSYAGELGGGGHDDGRKANPS